MSRLWHFKNEGKKINREGGRAVGPRNGGLVAFWQKNCKSGLEGTCRKSHKKVSPHVLGSLCMRNFTMIWQHPWFKCCHSCHWVHWSIWDCYHLVLQHEFIEVVSSSVSPWFWKYSCFCALVTMVGFDSSTGRCDCTRICMCRGWLVPQWARFVYQIRYHISSEGSSVNFSVL